MSAKPSQRKCKAAGCNNMVTLFNSLQPYCSPSCGYALSQQLLKKKSDKEKLQAKRERNAIKKTFRENDIKHVKAQAKAYCHRWIKWRDHKKGICFACRKSMAHLPARAIHAMHFRPSGSKSAVRYHEDNLRLGCYSCNSKNGGNLIEYEKHLIDDIGIERVEWLKAQNQVKKWTIEELRAVRDDYAGRLKALGLPLPSANR